MLCSATERFRSCDYLSNLGLAATCDSIKPGFVISDSNFSLALEFSFFEKIKIKLEVADLSKPDLPN